MSVADYEALARARMDRGAFDYFAGGAGDERTLAMNVSAFDRWVLRPRVLVDMRSVDTSTTVLGQPLRSPILLAPAAFHRLAHPEGERATARAAAAAGTVFVVSTVSSVSIEEVAASAAGAPLWFQLYAYKDPAITRDMVARAEAAGCRALVLTVDTPMLGRRERDARNRFALPEGIEPANFAAIHHLVAAHAAREGQSPFHAQVQQLFDPSLDWEKVAWLKSITRMPVLLKGVVTPEDARLAVQAGVAGIVVSNHGGRQLDGAEATLMALPRVVDAVAGALPVMMDGGIRRGVHVLTALALGAKAVFIGRPYLWGLAVDGERGVRGVCELLREELELAMALSGRSSVDRIDRSLVAEG
ncbi:MAG: alpha-hydroxy acid oxidase [Candidatus Eiseniibacteriota bacterium]